MTDITLAGVTRTYGQTHALAGLDLQIRAGEILGVAGPNGAGKSTFIRIVSGAEDPDGGVLRFDDETPAAAERRTRVAVVHQEPQLFPTLTVEENVLTDATVFQWSRPRADATRVDVLRRLGIEQYAKVPVEDCTLVVKQLTSIARAVVRDAETFLFDEPNSALTEDECAELFRTMRSLAESGKAVVFITHRLHELAALADRIVVIRDGVAAATLVHPDISERRIAAELVAGVEVQSRHVRDAAGSDHILETRGLTHPSGAFRNVTMTVDAGQVVAVFGVEGSGAREFLAAVAGLAPSRGDRIVRSTADDEDDVVYLPADRRTSLFGHFTVEGNLNARNGMKEIGTRLGLLRRRAMASRAADLVTRFNVKTASIDTPIASLSGGNQQKVAIAAAVARRPAMLLVEEPTRGVDIGSRAEILSIVSRFVGPEHAALLYCCEISEAYEVADSIVVFHEGVARGAVNTADCANLVELAERVVAVTQAKVS